VSDDILKRAMAGVHAIDVRTRGSLDAPLAGAHRSRHVGQGLEFDQVREYVVGDDVRAIDWNVTARSGRTHVKQYHEDRELTVVLVVDASASMDFGAGEHPRREIAAEIACLLALSAGRAGDRVAAVVHTDRIEAVVPPGTGRTHALRIAHAVLSCEPQGSGTDLIQGLEAARRMVRRGAVTFVIGDFTRLDEDVLDSLGLLAARGDVAALQLYDPRERELPDVGRLVVEDRETGEVIELDTGSADVRRRFAGAAAQRRQELRHALLSRGVDHLELDDSRPYLAPLVGFMQRRGRGAA